MQQRVFRRLAPQRAAYQSPPKAMPLRRHRMPRNNMAALCQTTAQQIISGLLMSLFS